MLLLYSVLAMGAIDRLAPVARWLERPWTLFGLVGLAAGLALVAACVPLFKRAQTRLRPAPGSTTLLTGGPYRFSRNPIYLGMALMLAGFAVTLGTVGPLIILPLFIAAIQLVWIRREESWMREAFGEPYEDYRRRVRAWI